MQLCSCQNRGKNHSSSDSLIDVHSNIDSAIDCDLYSKSYVNGCNDKASNFDPFSNVLYGLSEYVCIRAVI